MAVWGFCDENMSGISEETVSQTKPIPPDQTNPMAVWGFCDENTSGISRETLSPNPERVRHRGG
jgi:hypothetical protein